MSISVPLDGNACVRLECPNCGSEFKTEMSAQRLSDVLAWSASRVMRSQGLSDGVDAEPVHQTVCPYCGHPGTSQGFLHPEHVGHVKRVVVREYIEPKITAMLDSAFSGVRNTKFLRVTHTAGPRRARSMVGPEPTDMVRVRCVACSAMFKVAASWRGAVQCCGCARELLAM